MTTPEEPPAGQQESDLPDDLVPDLLGEERSRYAVPLTTLVGGAYVGVADQVTSQPDPHAPDAWTGLVPRVADGGGGFGGDGE